MSKIARLSTWWPATGVVAAVLIGLCGAATAKPWWMRGVESNENDFLPPDVAFRVGARIDGNAVKVRWVIADGYYLYRQRMDIKAESPDLVLAPPVFPAGILKTDPYLGSQEIYQAEVEATAAFTRSDFGAHPLEIKVTYQGCASAGLCYPPISKVIFPSVAAPRAAVIGHPWEAGAILAGGCAFLGAGLLLRRGRRLPMPAA